MCQSRGDRELTTDLRRFGQSRTCPYPRQFDGEGDAGPRRRGGTDSRGGDARRRSHRRRERATQLELSTERGGMCRGKWESNPRERNEKEVREERLGDSNANTESELKKRQHALTPHCRAIASQPVVRGKALRDGCERLLYSVGRVGKELLEEGDGLEMRGARTLDGCSPAKRQMATRGTHKSRRHEHRARTHSSGEVGRSRSSETR